MSAHVDLQLNFPYGCCDENGQPTLLSPGVCRGHIDMFDEEESQVEWEAGGNASFQLSAHAYMNGTPGSTHYGGSCQVGFSLDHGQSWKMAGSFHGNCPHRLRGGSPEDQTFHFRVPRGMPSGDALFGWVWLNREHEFFMNCAKVHITNTAANSSTPTEKLSQLHSSKGCDWETAPSMATSYYTVDAACMPNAKLLNEQSDDFELGWNVTCGKVDGDAAYALRIVECEL